MESGGERNALRNIMASYSVLVRSAVQDWFSLLNAHIANHDKLVSSRNNGSFSHIDDNGIPEIIENALPPLPPHPDTDKGRTEVLRELQTDFFVHFTDWTPEEMCFFTMFAFPRDKFSFILQQDANIPYFFNYLFEKWNPTLLDWIIFMWKYSQAACELFSDFLHLFISEQGIEFSDLAPTLYRHMLQLGYYDERTCMSITMAIIPYSRVPSCAIRHSECIMQMAKTLSPYQVGLIVRSLLFGQAQPYNCDCGYELDETYCRCVIINPPNQHEGNPNIHRSNSRFKELERNEKRKKSLIALDSGKVYAIILLQILMKKLQAPDLTNSDNKWNDKMINKLIVSSCEHVFTAATYATIFKTVAEWTGNTLPMYQQHPRPHSQLFHDGGEFRNAEHDFENSQAQTGSCIVANCKQSAKLDCANVSCKTHCPDFFCVCHVHRYYPKNKSYRPRLKISYTLDEQGNVITAEDAEGPVPRDPDLI